MTSLFAIDHSYLIPLLPLLGAVVAGFFGARFLKGASHWPIWIGVGGSAVLSLTLLFGMLGRSHGGSVTPMDSEFKAQGRYAQLFDPKNPYARPTNTAEEIRQGNQERLKLSPMRMAASVDWYTWIRAGAFKATAGFFFDPLTAVMLAVVTGIGFLITVFAAGYMKGEAGYFRFFAYLGLFLFAMTILVMGNNFVMLYLGWEGVGLCSYLLIGYYYDKPAAREAAKKAFLVNRVGDFGFGIGIMLIYLVFGTVSYFGDASQRGALLLVTDAAFINSLPAWKLSLIPWIPFCLMIGAFGKSAQFPLHVWLPDAMEGPTPVSALIHAATMVTAGVYMIVRCGTLFVANNLTGTGDAPMITVAVIGAFTALFAATIALRQYDLKKVFAYSTVSQLGFMFVGVAVLAPVAGVFHLVTHAFFKALLFLSSGVVMHAMLGHLDLRKMSGLKRVLPRTRVVMLIGCLALAGVPGLSGFFSKDEIIHHALDHSKVLGGVLLLTAFLTAYYTFRVYFRVFEGLEVVPTTPAEGHHGHDEHPADAHAHASASAVKEGDVHESGVDRSHAAAPPAHGHGHGHHNHEPWIMLAPLFILAVGAFLAGYLNWPKHGLGHFLSQSPSVERTYVLAAGTYSGTSASAGHHPVDPAGFGLPTYDDQYNVIHSSPFTWVMLLSLLIAGLGVLLAYQLHLKDRAKGDALPARSPLATRLFEAKYWVDEIYQNGIVEPLRGFGRVLFAIDRYFVDGLVWLVGFVPQVFGFAIKLTTQRGSLQGYAVMMILGVAAVLLYVFA